MTTNQTPYELHIPSFILFWLTNMSTKIHYYIQTGKVHNFEMSIVLLMEVVAGSCRIPTGHHYLMTLQANLKKRMT